MHFELRIIARPGIDPSQADAVDARRWRAEEAKDGRHHVAQPGNRRHAARRYAGSTDDERHA